MSLCTMGKTSLLDDLLALSLNDVPKCENKEENDVIHKEMVLAGKMKLKCLPNYEIPSDILNVEKSGDHQNAACFTKLMDNLPQIRRNERDYVTAYKTMIYLEEAANCHFLSRFDKTNIQLKYTGKGRVFSINKSDEVAEMSEAIDEGLLEHFVLKPVGKMVRSNIGGYVNRINDDNIFVEIFEESFEYMRRKCSRESYDISFCVNRQPFQLQHNALKWMLEHNLFNCLIDSPKYDDDANSYGFIDERYNFCGQLSTKLNEEQKAAVVNIVTAKSFPQPYLLFGPAGTGKTSTLAAAIEEIIRSSSKCVLVCANSNAACDELTERLLNVLSDGEMFRMYAKSYSSMRISERIKPICNWLNGEFHFPSLKFLYQFRVLVCTLSVAGYLTCVQDTSHFVSDHFSHVIIDECASTHETVSLIAIAGLCTSYGKIESNIVLAGDPKQLDAVTKSNYAIKLGFKTSLMEQLFNRRLYKRNSNSGRFNPNYVTQLVRNYRSHPNILKIPNELFYENKLEAHASKDTTNRYIDSELLPSKNFPIIFKSVQGICERSPNDFSLVNIDEIDVVIDFIKILLENDGNVDSLKQSDIGVVTPYKLQCKELIRACRQNKFNDITIGTAEIFQGQEKPVMIVSTVRTERKLGFVKDPRRLNVIITRAKCLLIVVGDPTTLELDQNWKAFIDYCIQNNALV